MNIEEKQEVSSKWFRFCAMKFVLNLKKIEEEFAAQNQLKNPQKFTRKNWDREGGGSGEMSLMKGNVFEKVGVNYSKVFGQFSEQFRSEIPGAEENPNFGQAEFHWLRI